MKYEARGLSYGSNLRDYVWEAMDFLRKYEPVEGYYLGFDGSAPSIVTFALAKKAGVRFEAYHPFTGIEAPETVRFIRREYPEVRWLFPQKSFYAYIREKCPPTRRERWCCDELKKYPSKCIPLRSRILSIVANRGANSYCKPRIEYCGSRISYKPVYYWPNDKIWGFIRSEGLPYCSLYDAGFDRVGCVFCPHIFKSDAESRKRLAMSQERWPKLWKAFEHAVHEWFSTMQAHMAWPSIQYIDFERFWRGYLSCGNIPKREAR